MDSQNSDNVAPVDLGRCEVRYGIADQPLRLLFIASEGNVVELVSRALRYDGWVVSTASDPLAAARNVASFVADVIVLDVALAVVDGVSVLRKIREHQPDAPLLVLGARQDFEQRAAGLVAGGDDYLVKPFSLEDLRHQLRLLMRQTGLLQSDSAVELCVGDLILDTDSHEVYRGGDEIHLTSQEYRLLRYLMANARRVLTKNQILDRAWDYSYSGGSNIVELYISYLRRKIDVGRPQMIFTVRGAGYILKPPDLNVDLNPADASASGEISELGIATGCAADVTACSDIRQEADGRWGRRLGGA